MKTVHEKTLEYSGAIVVVVDNDGKAEYVSSSVKEVLGFEPEKLLGEGWFSFTAMNSNDRESILSQLSGITSGTSVAVPYERLLRTAWGGQKWILWKTSRNTNGRLVGIGYDISERKSKEQLLEKKTRVLEERTHEMEASLRYAKRIQETILPSEHIIEKHFTSSFVFYRAKDIVSGDWWWVHETEEALYVAVIDCTGHGVPGALLSVLTHSIFREVFVNNEKRTPSQILSVIDNELRRSFRSDETPDHQLDGMDVSLIRYSQKDRSVEFAGAGRPLFTKRKGDLLVIKGDIHSIGGFAGPDKIFTDHVLYLEEGDTIYLFSDGFTDQFGGQHDRKLGSRGFRELLNSMRGMNAVEQGSFLAYALQNWRQETEQTDDITVIGLQV